MSSRVIRPLYAVIVLTGGCVAQLPLPNIPHVVGTENVVMAVRQEIDTQDCENLGRVSASDGLTGPPHTLRYIGTEERAMALLKIQAVQFGADTIVLTDTIESLRRSEETGYRVQLVGLAYQCRGGPFVQRQ